MKIFLTILAQMLLPTMIQSRRALRTAIAVTTASFIAIAFHFEMPYWAAISALVIMDRFIGVTLFKGLLRILGTLTGALLGYILAQYVAQDFFVFIFCFFLIVAMACYFSLTSRYPYAFLITGVTTLLVMGNVILTPEKIYFAAIWRAIEIITGTTLAMICVFMIIPTNAEKIIGDLIDEQMKNIKNLLAEVFQLYLIPHPLCSSIKNDAQTILLALNLGLENCDAAQKEGVHNAITIYQLKHLILWQIELTKYIKYIYFSYHETFSYIIINEFSAEIKDIIKTIDELILAISIKENTNNFLLLLKTLQIKFNELEKAYELKRPQGTLLAYPMEEVMSLNQFIQNIRTLMTLFSKLYTMIPGNQPQKVEEDLDYDIPPLFQGKQLRLTLQQSIKAGLSAILALSLWMCTNWPGGLQGLISSFFISLQKNIYDVQLIAELRFLGCIIGGATGLICFYYFELNIVTLLVLLFIFSWIFAYFSYSDSKYSYAALQANFALILTLVEGFGPPTSINAPLQRLFGVMLGIVATFIVGRFIWPAHPKKLLEDALARILAILINLFSSIFIKKQLLAPQRVHMRFALSSYFQQPVALLTSIRTYTHEDNAMVQRLDKIIDLEKQITTILFSLAESCNLTQALHMAQVLGINGSQYLISIEQHLNYLLSPRSDEIARLDNLQQHMLEDFKRLRLMPLPLPYPHSELANIMALFYGLINLLECCKNLVLNNSPQSAEKLIEQNSPVGNHHVF